jgi:PAS domain S-box-containing protein
MRTTVQENLSDGVYFVDRGRRILYWNKGAERITGYSKDEVLGRRCRDNLLNHCDDAGTILCTTHRRRKSPPRQGDAGRLDQAVRRRRPLVRSVVR